MSADDVSNIVRILLDCVDESLLGTLAEQHGRTKEEEASVILANELQKQAKLGIRHQTLLIKQLGANH